MSRLIERRAPGSLGNGMRLSLPRLVMILAVVGGSTAFGADEAKIRQATEQAAAGQYLQAATTLAPVLSDEAAPDEALEVAFDAQLAAGAINQAAITLDRLTKRHAGKPTAAIALLRQARLEVARGEVESASNTLKATLAQVEKTAESALEIAPVEVELGYVELSLGHLDTAEAAFKSAIRRLDDEHAKYHELNIDHDHDAFFTADGTAGLAFCRASRQDAKGAERLFKRAVARPEVSPQALLLAWRFFREGGDARQAQMAQAESRLIRLAQNLPDARRALIWVLVEQGGTENLKKARDLGLDLIKGRRDAETLIALAIAQHASGQNAQAVELVREALASNFRDAHLLEACAKVLETAGDNATANDLRARAKSLAPRASAE